VLQPPETFHFRKVVKLGKPSEKVDGTVIKDPRIPNGSTLTRQQTLLALQQLTAPTVPRKHYYSFKILNLY
jgi:hypothetical protein